MTWCRRSSPSRGSRLNDLQAVSSYALAALCAASLVAAGTLTLDSVLAPAAADPPAVSTAPQPMGQVPAVTTVNLAPLDEPIRLLTQASQTYQQVQDYACTMVKQERVRGQLQPEEVIRLKVRKEPFSVHMQWAAPRKMAGQEVFYVHGRNNNQMRVRMPGLAKAIGFVSVSPNDPRALEHSRHTITEAGIGNLIARCLADWQQERTLNRTQVQTAEYLFDNKPCVRVEVAQTSRTQQDYCYRTVLYLDKQTRLPVRIECYDFPQAGGSPGGEVLEVYSYVNTRYNLGLTDADFRDER